MATVLLKHTSSSVELHTTAFLPLSVNGEGNLEVAGEIHRFRKATTEDAAQLTLLINSAYSAFMSPFFIDPRWKRTSLERVQNMIKDPNKTFYLIENETRCKILATALLKPGANTSEMEGEHFAVDREAKGLGRLLYPTILAYLCQQKKTAVSFEVFSLLPSLIKYYEEGGAITVDTRQIPQELSDCLKPEIAKKAYFKIMKFMLSSLPKSKL